MIGHINNKLSLRDKLVDIGEDIIDSHIYAPQLCSLSHSYDHLVITLEARNEKDLTIEFVKNKFMDEHKHRCENREASSNSRYS